MLLAPTFAVVLVASRRRRIGRAVPLRPTAAALIPSRLPALGQGAVTAVRPLDTSPFFALVRVRAWWWIAYTFDALVLYGGVCFVLGTVSLQALEIVVPAGVYVRRCCWSY